MSNYDIIQLNPDDYHKCSNIWNMEKRPELAKSFYDELVSGNRIIYIYSIDGEFIGEGAIVFERNDPDYSIPGKRLYFSRLVVKEEYRKQGIGGILIDYIVNKAIELGYIEISIGVDKKNEGALRLYRRKGFDEIIYDGEDEYGPYYKLLKRLDDNSLKNISYRNNITVQDYNNLRIAVGWGACKPDRVSMALERSDFITAAHMNDSTIGMARVTHDGLQALVMDVIVLPEYQGRGIDKKMMKHIMRYLDDVSQEGGIFVNLMSAQGRESFYEQFDFERRPNDKRGPGMTQWISGKEGLSC